MGTCMTMSTGIIITNTTTPTAMATATIMTTEPPLTAAHLQRLQTWFGPSFPVGAFSYSHGLEAAFEAGLVTNRESLTDWLEGLLLFGSARNDAILFAETYRRWPDVAEVVELAAALSPSMELRAETLNQGAAFLRAVRQGWPGLYLEHNTEPRKDVSPERGLPGGSAQAAGDPVPRSARPGIGEALAANASPTVSEHGTEPRKDVSPERGLLGGNAQAAGDPVPRAARPGIGEVLSGEVALPVAAGLCCAAAGIPLKPALTAYLHAFTANIVSAALRCIPLGQSDGLAAQSALEPAVEAAADAGLEASPGDIGSAAPMLDWLSATHETQYSRLFRS